jgi:hypothetical protein
VLTDETKAVLDQIANAAADLVSATQTPFVEYVANFLRKNGGELLAKACEKLGVTQIVTVKVDPGVPVTGGIDLSDPT